VRNEIFKEGWMTAVLLMKIDIPVSKPVFGKQMDEVMQGFTVQIYSVKCVYEMPKLVKITSKYTIFIP
jgi:hypothetical protein